MKRSKFSEEQIAYALRQAEGGTPAGDVCRQLGISEATFYQWKKKFAHLGVSELRRMRQMEEENRRLKGQVIASLPSWPSSRLPYQSPSESYLPWVSCAARAYPARRSTALALPNPSTRCRPGMWGIWRATLGRSTPGACSTLGGAEAHDAPARSTSAHPQLSCRSLPAFLQQCSQQ